MARKSAVDLGDDLTLEEARELMPVGWRLTEIPPSGRNRRRWKATNEWANITSFLFQNVLTKTMILNLRRMQRGS